MAEETNSPPITGSVSQPQSRVPLPEAPIQESPLAVERKAPRLGLYLTSVLIGYFFWNLPGFINILEALKLRTQSRCSIRGFSKYVYTYPMIPISIGCAIGAWAGIPMLFLVVFWILSLQCALHAGTENISGRHTVVTWIVVFLLFVLYVLAEVLMWKLYQRPMGIARGLSNVLGMPAPIINAGAFLLAGASFVPRNIVLLVRTAYSHKIIIDGNTYLAISEMTNEPFQADQWRLRSIVSDLLERYWMGAVTLELVWGPNAKSGKKGMSAEREGFELVDVPGGLIVEWLVVKAMSTEDVELAETTPE